MANTPTTTPAPAPAVPNKPLEEFHLFPKLPVELRNRIYGLIEVPYTETHVHAIRGFPEHVLQEKASEHNPPQQPIEPSPPTTLFWPNADYVFPKGTPIAYYTYYLKSGRFFSTTAPQIHPILQACKETRDFYVNKFNLVRPFDTFFNLDRDILFLDASTAINHAEVKNPGIEAFAELLRHPELIKQIKKIAFHVQADNSHWILKCAQKIKGELVKLEEVYLVWKDEEEGLRPNTFHLTGKNTLFVDMAGTDNSSLAKQMRKKAEHCWKDAIPDSGAVDKKIKVEAVPKRTSLKRKIKAEDASDSEGPAWKRRGRKKVGISDVSEEPTRKQKKKTADVKGPKFIHVVAKEAMFGFDHGVVSHAEFVAGQQSNLAGRPSSLSSPAGSVIHCAPSYNQSFSAVPSPKMVEQPVVQSQRFPGCTPSSSVGLLSAARFALGQSPVQNGGYSGAQRLAGVNKPAQNRGVAEASRPAVHRFPFQSQPVQTGKFTRSSTALNRPAQQTLYPRLGTQQSSLPLAQAQKFAAQHPSVAYPLVQQPISQQPLLPPAQGQHSTVQRPAAQYSSVIYPNAQQSVSQQPLLPRPQAQYPVQHPQILHGQPQYPTQHPNYYTHPSIPRPQLQHTQTWNTSSQAQIQTQYQNHLSSSFPSQQPRTPAPTTYASFQSQSFTSYQPPIPSNLAIMQSVAKTPSTGGFPIPPANRFSASPDIPTVPDLVAEQNRMHEEAVRGAARMGYRY